MSNINFFRMLRRANGAGSVKEFVFVSEWVMVTYEFNDGSDLDTRTRIVSPNIGQTSISTYLGYSLQVQWPSTSPFLEWGRDNMGNGFESVLFNVTQYKAAYPSSNNVLMDLRAFWYRNTGQLPVNIDVTLWKGGTPTRASNSYAWTNSTATETFNVASVGKLITLNTQNVNSETGTQGERVATLSYNVINGIGTLDANDQNTPTI